MINNDQTVLKKIQEITKKKLLQYKLTCEANIVSLIYKYPELIQEYDLTVNDFNENCWKVYFEIARVVCEKEEKKILDEITVGLFLEKHLKLKAKYEEYGGFEMINEASKYVKRENYDGYVKELNKYKTLLMLNDNGFPIYDRLSDFLDMTTDEIYDEYEALLNHTFINLSSDYSAYDISDGIYDLIDRLDEGEALGLPYHDMPILTSETSGSSLGNITLIGGLSNVGKSTFLRNTILPSIIKNNEKIVIMLNEEDLDKWQRELLVFVANNILKEDLKKKEVRNGGYKIDRKQLLFKAADWIKENTKNKNITIINFTHYRTSNVLKVIRKYSALGVKYFALDTFKLDSGDVNNQSWLLMQQSMVAIHDLIKKANKNVNITITFQLTKGSTRQRFYTFDNIGLAKNIADPVSTVIMIRKVFDDEKAGEKKQLEVRDKDNNLVFLDPKKNYQAVFIVKTREGAANDFQIIIEHDLSRNTLKEVGITRIPMDF